MRTIPALFAVLATTIPFSASADPSDECGVGASSQVEIGNCVAQAAETVDKTIEIALRFAMDQARELDSVTGRALSVPALEAGQAAWSAYRDAHCDYVGSTFGGGSGTGIAIQSCRVELGRARVDTLMRFAQ